LVVESAIKNDAANSSVLKACNHKIVAHDVALDLLGLQPETGNHFFNKSLEFQ